MRASQMNAQLGMSPNSHPQMDRLAQRGQNSPMVSRRGAPAGPQVKQQNKQNQFKIFLKKKMINKKQYLAGPANPQAAMMGGGNGGNGLFFFFFFFYLSFFFFQFLSNRRQFWSARWQQQHDDGWRRHHWSSQAQQIVQQQHTEHVSSRNAPQPHALSLRRLAREARSQFVYAQQQWCCSAWCWCWCWCWSTSANESRSVGAWSRVNGWRFARGWRTIRRSGSGGPQPRHCCWWTCTVAEQRTSNAFLQQRTSNAFLQQRTSNAFLQQRTSNAFL